jgi:hypothetical protein
MSNGWQRLFPPWPIDLVACDFTAAWQWPTPAAQSTGVRSAETWNKEALRLLISRRLAARGAHGIPAQSQQTQTQQQKIAVR